MCECDECVRFVDDDQCLSGARYIGASATVTKRRKDGDRESAMMMMCESDKGRVRQTV